MRTLIVEVEAGTRTVEEEGRSKRGSSFTRTREVPVYQLLKIEIPDNAKVTLQGMNPANNYKGSGNPTMLRVYQGSDKKQLACIPNVVGFREDHIKVSRLVDKPNVIGKSWDEIKGSMLGPEAQWYRLNEDDELEELDF